MRPVLVFTYHHVSPRRGDKFSVTPETFEAHLRALAQKGYEPLFIHDAARLIRGEVRGPGRAVVITLDDGYLDNYLFAFPVLKRLNMKATIFAVTSWVDAATQGFGMRSPRDAPATHDEAKRLIREGRAEDTIFTWDEAGEMVSSGLVSVESHGHSHQKATDLCDAGDLYDELALSRETIARMLGQESRTLCWPYGLYDRRCIEEARRAGFTASVTVERGVNSRGSDPFRIKRITAKERGPGWVLKSAFIFSNPVLGGLYARIKPR